MSDAYLDFLKAKMRVASFSGFEIDPAEIHPWCRKMAAPTLFDLLKAEEAA